MHARVCVVSLCGTRSPDFVYYDINDATRLFKAKHSRKAQKAQAHRYPGYKSLGHVYLPLWEARTFTGLPMT